MQVKISHTKIKSKLLIFEPMNMEWKNWFYSQIFVNNKIPYYNFVSNKMIMEFYKFYIV